MRPGDSCGPPTDPIVTPSTGGRHDVRSHRILEGQHSRAGPQRLGVGGAAHVRSKPLERAKGSRSNPGIKTCRPGPEQTRCCCDRALRQR